MQAEEQRKMYEREARMQINSAQQHHHNILGSSGAMTGLGGF
jgi:hypothetical protein